MFAVPSNETPPIVLALASAVVVAERVVELGGSEVDFSMLDGVDFSSVTLTLLSISTNVSSFITK